MSLYHNNHNKLLKIKIVINHEFYESVSTRHVFLSTGFRKEWSYEIPVLVNYRGFVKTQIRAFVIKKQGYRNEFYRVIVTAILIYTTSEHQHLNYRDFVKNFTELS